MHGLKEDWIEAIQARFPDERYTTRCISNIADPTNEQLARTLAIAMATLLANKSSHPLRLTIQFDKISVDYVQTIERFQPEVFRRIK